MAGKKVSGNTGKRINTPGEERFVASGKGIVLLNDSKTRAPAAKSGKSSTKKGGK